MRAISAFFILVLIPGFGWADTVQVPNDYPTITQALEASQSGDMIVVFPGTYSERIDFAGKALFVRSTSGAEATVIDGMGEGSVVSFTNGEGPGSVLRGFTLKNGIGTYDTVQRGVFGGGIFCKSASPTLQQLVIKDNQAEKGAGIYCYGSYLNLANCTLESNVASQAGGGAYFLNASAGFSFCQIIGNRAVFSDGGGIYCANSPLAMTHSKVVHNESGYWGGGICTFFSPIVWLVNSYLAYNQAEASGGGVAVFMGTALDAVNCTFRDNRAVLGAGGSLFMNLTDQGRVLNSIFWGGAAPAGPEAAFENSSLGVDYCLMQGGFQSLSAQGGDLIFGSDNLDCDPLFSDADGHISINSPCADAGSNASSFIPTLDIDNDPRILFFQGPRFPTRSGSSEPRVDIGIDEVTRFKFTKPASLFD